MCSGRIIRSYSTSEYVFIIRRHLYLALQQQPYSTTCFCSLVQNGTHYFVVHQSSCNAVKNAQHSLWNIYKNKTGYESNQHDFNHFVMHYSYSLFQYAIYLNSCYQYYNRREFYISKVMLFQFVFEGFNIWKLTYYQI